MTKEQKQWKNSIPPENKSVLVYVHSRKTGKNCFSIAKNICGFWFLERFIDEINIPVLSEYEILYWMELPLKPLITEDLK